MVSQLGTEVQGLKTALANSSVRLTNHELNRFIVMLLSFFTLMMHIMQEERSIREFDKKIPCCQGSSQ